MKIIFGMKNLSCLRYSKLRSKEIVSNFKKDQDSLFGIIEYIDHLYKPFNFLQKSLISIIIFL